MVLFLYYSKISPLISAKNCITYLCKTKNQTERKCTMNRRLLFPALFSTLAAMLTLLLTGCTYATSTTGYIGLEEARQIALEEAGLTENDVRWEERAFDLDDDTPVYELEFRANGYEYSVDIHAVTGAVLDYDVDRDK